MVMSFWTLCLFSGGAAVCGASWMHLRQKRLLSQLHDEIEGLKGESQNQQRQYEAQAHREKKLLAKQPSKSNTTETLKKIVLV